MQGTIRDNLDPMRQFSDRDMIRVLKDVGLWEILCGISLSNSKDEESPRFNNRSRALIVDPGGRPAQHAPEASVT